MTSKRTIFTEAAMVVAILTTGISAAEAARAAPVSTVLQASNAVDPRANVAIESKVHVERTEPDAVGNGVTKLYAPADIKVVPGDKLVFTNAYRNRGSTAVTGFVVNNPVHAAVAFSGVTEDWALVSIDGGKSFGKLTEMTVTKPVSTNPGSESTTDDSAPQVTRAAQPSDVTHIRWVFASPIAAGGSGELSFRGIVK